MTPFDPDLPFRGARQPTVPLEPVRRRCSKCLSLRSQILNAVSAVLDQLNPDILKTSDGEALLKAAIGLGVEAVVSKKRGSPYRSGPCRDWVKVKSAIWREANRERWSLLQRQG